MTEQELEFFRAKCLTGFHKLMGMEILSADESGTCVMEMPVTENHLNPMGTVHGGVLFGLADTVGGFAIWAMGDTVCTTCTSSIDFFNPTMGAKKIIGRAQVLKRGKTMSTVEVTLYTEEDRPVAKLIGRYYHLNISYKN